MSLTVLIVDDSKLARMSVSKALIALYPHWKKVEAANAEEALVIARTSPPDVALLDFNMPGRDGLELAAEIRMLAPNVPIAIISANMQTEIVSRAARVGATFLPKPLTQDALATFLSAVAARSGGPV